MMTEGSNHGDQRIVFINYRRTDAGWPADHIASQLQRTFGADRVYLDVRGIDAGDDFASDIEEHLLRASVLLVLIGRDWLRVHDKHGRRRLDRDDDWVRKEIRFGLERETCRVIPVLIDDGELPDERDALPSDIAGLLGRQRLRLRQTNSQDDLEALSKELEKAGFERVSVDGALGGGNEAVVSLRQIPQRQGTGFIKETVELGAKYVWHYSESLLLAVQEPARMAAGQGLGPQSRAAGVETSTLAFVLGNVALGSTFSGLLPGRPTLKSLGTIAVVLLVLWCLLGIAIHVVCRALGGRGSLRSTINTGLRVCSFVYLLSTCLAFLWLVVLAAYPTLSAYLGSSSWPLANIWLLDYLVLFPLQTVLLLVYFPASLKRIHALTGMRGTLASVAAPVLTVGLGLPVFLVGGC